MTDSYVALDLETTGIGAKKEKITVTSMRLFFNLKVVNQANYCI